MFMKLFLLCFTFLLCACSGDYLAYDDWSPFEKYKDAEIEGAPIHCETLVNIKIKRKYRGWASSEYYEESILDYIKYSDYEFSSCKELISKKRSEYCNSSEFEDTGETYLRDPHFGLSAKYYYFCKNELPKSIKKVASRYQMPTNTNKFITLHDEGVLVNPKSISKISYKTYKLGGWEITLHSDWSYSLYFGKEEDFKLALRLLSESVSLTLTDEK